MKRNDILAFILSDPKVRQVIEDVFWSKVEKTNTCWLWKGAKRHNYGELFILPPQPAHRLSWFFLRGAIPDKLVIDHLCRNPSCVNPEHLEPITHQENIRRGYALKTHCPKGHPLLGENLSQSKLKKGWRVCQVCERIRDNKRHIRDRTKRNLAKRQNYYTHQAERQQYAKDYYYAKKEVMG